MPQKLGFGLGAFIDMWGHWFYPTLALHVYNVFLGVAPELISTAQMIKIIIDAVSDTVFGWISDNTRTRFGRRRPFILVGGVLRHWAAVYVCGGARGGATHSTSSS